MPYISSKMAALSLPKPAASPRPEVRPLIPDRIEDLGIPRALVSDLILRYLWLHGTATLAALNETLKLSFPVLETMFHQFRQQQLLEVKGMVGNDYSFSLTGAGPGAWPRRAARCASTWGAAPVSIQQYHEVVKAQAAQVRLSRDSLRQAFHDLVLPDGLLDQLGPSLIGHQSLFLYGGTGNGKTSIAERILRIYHDNVLVPYAVEVDGHIITVFDPVVHRRRWPATTNCSIRAGWCASGPASRWAASFRPPCWNCGWTRPRTSSSRRAR